ncbi:hypothetical protein EXIGLDRAFT_775683 [Exidia glandulosa HHB12029]|uniref:Uncharacterized protein n=1 Tax=Exidia glandulosa HHB12029 TaxID=1314781 RepID=A0A165DTM3_EXIGL|nr:hypothetical protein EXIGLDRAFT_775683 [Exidia glandulosa HHB12029]
MHSFAFILFFVAFSLVSASPLLQEEEAQREELDSLIHELGRRGVCAGVEMRGGGGKPQAPDYYGIICRTQTRYPSAYTFDDSKAQTTAFTNVAADGSVYPTEVGKPKGHNNWVCDHIVELSLLQAVIDNRHHPSVCGYLQQRVHRTQVPKYIQGIKALINSIENLVYFEFSIEKLKGETMRQYLNTGVHAPARVKELGNRQATDLEWMALNSYLQQTAHRTQYVAQQIDNAIRHSFPGSYYGVAQKWQQYMAQVDTVAQLARQSATNTQHQLYCAQQQRGHQYPQHPGYPPHYPRGLVARFVDFADTLLRRAGVKTAPKITKGSKDQPAMSCPMPPKSTNGTTPATGKTPTKAGTKTPTHGKKPVVVKKPPTTRKPTKPKPIVKKPSRPVRPPPRRPTRPPPRKAGRPRSLE